MVSRRSYTAWRCFIGGNLVLAAHTLPKEETDPEQLKQWGDGITETCHQMYARTSASTSCSVHRSLRSHIQITGPRLVVILVKTESFFTLWFCFPEGNGRASLRECRRCAFFWSLLAEAGRTREDPPTAQAHRTWSGVHDVSRRVGIAK